MAKTVEELEAELAQLRANLQGLAQERDQYRAQAQDGNRGGGGYQYNPNGHVLGRTLGVEADFSGVDQYYVPRSQYDADMKRIQQEAVNQAYNLSRGDILVLREIDRAQASYKDLSKWDSPLAKKTFEVLQKEGYASPRQGVQPQSWEDLVYGDVRALPRAARIAQAELLMEQQQAAASTAQAAQAGQAATMASGGAPAGTGQAASEEEWMKLAEGGDTGKMRDALKTHVETVSGQSVT